MNIRGGGRLDLRIVGIKFSAISSFKGSGGIPLRYYLLGAGGGEPGGGGGIFEDGGVS